METVKLWEREEYTYPVIGDFIPTITSYIHEDGQVRPVFMVVPGGGYEMVSPSEGEIVARKFYEKGFQCFVVTYTTRMPGPDPVRFQAMKDLAKAIAYVRKNAAQLKADPDNVTVCGFSAGAHLCGCLAVHYDEPEIQPKGEYSGIKVRPDYAVLSYPVITSGKYAHKGSFIALLGKDATGEELSYMSLEKHVDGNTPPIFLWQTASDETVPVKNSCLMAEACKKAGIPYEHHIFHKGMHGLSLANEEWAKGEYGGLYCMKQLSEYITYCIEHGDTPVEPFSGLGALPKGTDIAELYMKNVAQFCNYKPEPCVQVWPELVENWLADLWNPPHEAHEQVPADAYYEVNELLPEVFRIGSPEGVFMDLFVGEEKALLFDTGYGYGNLKDTVKKVTGKPLYIVNSHGHLDHTCGNFQFEEDIYIHEKDIPLCMAHNAREKRSGAAETARHTVDYFTKQEHSILPSDFDEETYCSAGYGKLCPLREGDVFELGGITLEVIELPGHTTGSIALLYREKKFLYVGDAVNGFLWLFMPEATMLSEYIETLGKVERIDFTQMLQSHNRMPVSKEMMKYYREAAETLDYENGEDFNTPLEPDAKARVCARAGKKMVNFMDPDFAAVVISREHI